MGIEKQGGNYVGGFLQLFGWKSKSRKKLFGGKSDIPEQSKQKKQNDGNLPSTRFQILDEGEIGAGSSLRGSSDYSCASSSVNDDDVTKAPNVVARLMGLDSLPKSNEPYSSPFCDAQSVSEAYFRTTNLEYCQDIQIMHSGSLSVQSDTKPKNPRPIKKFQTEIFPPKSAKSIPITRNKLLSPIKNVNSLPAKDAANIMEAAARIIGRGPQASTETKLTPVCSSSIPLKVKDLKENVNTAQKRSMVDGVSYISGESSVVKYVKGHSANKSRNGAVDSTLMSVYSDSKAKNKGKSVSLALQAKSNVQKRRINGSGNTMVIEKEASDFKEYQLFKSQSTAEKSSVKKLDRKNGSVVLRLNNQKQNCMADGGKETLKNHLKKGKAVNRDSLSARQQNSGKASGTSRISSKKLGLNFKDNKREIMSSSSEIVTRKRSIDGTYHSEKDRVENNEKRFQSGKTSWEQNTGSKGSDVVSFTFNAPLTRSGLGSGRHFENGESYTMFPDDYRSKRTLLSSDGMSAARFSYPEHNMRGSDLFGALFEQKLKELNDLVELAQHKTGSDDMVNAENKHSTNYMVSSSIFQARKLIDSRLPYPVSTLDHSSFAESCNSTNTAESHSSKHCSSTQAREVLPNSMNKFLPNEEYVALSDSVSSISAQSFANQRRCELDCVNEILFNVELTFENYALGKASELIDPYHFEQMESRKWYFGQSEEVSKTNQRRLMFDSVSECLDIRCRKYGNGGYRLWAKGKLVAKRKEILAEEVYKEITGWSELGDLMVDEILDKDMSSQYGRWLDFDIDAFEIGVQIQSHILNSLIEEVVDNLVLSLSC